MVKKIFSRLFIFFVLLLLYLPIMVLVVFSFSEAGRTITFDAFKDFKFGFGLYKSLFANEAIMTAVGNTVLIAIISSLIATIIGTLACTGIQAMKQKSRNLLMNMNQIPVINADIVTSFALMLSFVALGVFSIKSAVEIGYITLIIAHVLISLPFIILTIMPRMRQLDENLYDAATDLGAKPFYAFTHVILPQIIPAMLTAFLLGFTLSLDDFVITQYNNNFGSVQTISTIVYSSTKRGVPPQFRALTAIIMLVVFIVLIAINIKPKKKRKNNLQTEKI
ncbi:MAG: ABC transporter permease [Christensenellaceae bacterium]|nr:ABC transporter permease [Christensenellaceae bacterium]